VAIALAVAGSPPNLDVLDLQDQITKLAEFIRANAREDVVLPVAPELAASGRAGPLTEGSDAS